MAPSKKRTQMVDEVQPSVEEGAQNLIDKLRGPDGARIHLDKELPWARN